MAQIPPIDDGYIDDVIKSNVPYNPTLNQTQGVKLRELVKLLRNRLEQVIAENHQIFTAALEAKVDKEVGKGLSQENFTLAFKNKLEELALMGIPAGPVDTIGTPVSENSPKLFYNTTSHTLRIYDPVSMTWRDVIEADLTNYYTKTEVDALLSSIPKPDMSKYLRKDTYNLLGDFGILSLEFGIEGRVNTNAAGVEVSSGDGNYSPQYCSDRIVRRAPSANINYLFPSNNSTSGYFNMPLSVNGNFADVNGEITVPTGGGTFQSVTTGTGNNSTSNIIQITGRDNLIGLDSKSGGIIGYNNASNNFVVQSLRQGGISDGMLSISPMTTILAKGVGETTLALRSESPILSGAYFNSRVGGLNAVNASEFITKSQLDNVQNSQPLKITSSTMHDSRTSGFKSSGGNVLVGNNAGLNAANASNSNMIGTDAGRGASETYDSNLIGYNAGKSYSGNNIGYNNIIIGTHVTLPNGQNNSINIGGVLYGTGTQLYSGGNPKFEPSSNGKVGIGALPVNSKLEVAGDMEVSTLNSGVIIKSPDGSRWRLTVSDAGDGIFTKL